jgi:pimeloyl-ACP methyl ester carboxylesterase
MKTTKLDPQVTLPPKETFTTRLVTSRDGTAIGYRQLGRGPGLVLVQGTMGTAHHFMQLAEELSDMFTVYTPDRRGRGMSGPGNQEYNMRKEVEDLETVLAATGALNVFGLSSGAMIALQAALSLSNIHKLAIFEPPLFINDTLPTHLIARYEKEMNQGKVAAALITGMKAGQFGPPIFNIMPRWLLEALTSLLMKSEEKNGSNGYVPMRRLASTLHYDFQLILEMSDTLDRFKDIRTEVLMLDGSKSPVYLKTISDALENILPHVTRVELPGLDHSAAWNTDRGGQPEFVAKELRRYFADC